MFEYSFVANCKEVFVCQAESLEAACRKYCAANCDVPFLIVYCHRCTAIMELQNMAKNRFGVSWVFRDLPRPVQAEVEF